MQEATGPHVESAAARLRAVQRRRSSARLRVGCGAMADVDSAQHEVVFRVAVIGGVGKRLLQLLKVQDGELSLGSVAGYKPRLVFEQFADDPWSGRRRRHALRSASSPRRRDCIHRRLRRRLPLLEHRRRAHFQNLGAPQVAHSQRDLRRPRPRRRLVFPLRRPCSRPSRPQKRGCDVDPQGARQSPASLQYPQHASTASSVRVERLAVGCGASRRTHHAKCGGKPRQK